MKMYRHGLMLAAATLGLSAAEASTGRLMRSPDDHPPAAPPKQPAAKKAAAKPAAKKPTAAERAAKKKADTERENAIRKNPAVAEQPAPPRRSAANTGAIENVADAAQRVPGGEQTAAPKPDKDGNFWPSWRYGPNGEGNVFNSAAEVPNGWKDHPGAFSKPESTLDL